MSFAVLFLIVAQVIQGASAVDPEVASSTVGLPKRIEQIVLPGSLLQVKELESRNSPFILRIVETFPHGDSFRYDIEYQALEPGTYRLTEYLERIDGGSTADLPEIAVTIATTLPPGQPLPTPLSQSDVGSFGGYRLWFSLAVIVWIAGLFALIFVGREGKRLDVAESEVEESPESRLDALISEAMDGRLPDGKRAELEREVIAFWTGHLGLGELPPAELPEKLRENDVAGPMLKSLEEWLHAPNSDKTIDLKTILKPIEDQKRFDLVDVNR